MSQNIFVVVILAVGYDATLAIDYVDLEAKDSSALTQQNSRIWNQKMTIGDMTDAFSLFSFQQKDRNKPGLVEFRATIKFVKAGGNVPQAWVNHKYDIEGNGIIQKEKLSGSAKKSGKITIGKGDIFKFVPTNYDSSPRPDFEATGTQAFFGDVATKISEALNDNILSAKIF